jgi:hypothetical protein
VITAASSAFVPEVRQFEVTWKVLAAEMTRLGQPQLVPLHPQAWHDVGTNGTHWAGPEHELQHALPQQT